MPRIIDSGGFGKHCHSCGVWMSRRALRKESTCHSCKNLIIAKGRKIYCVASRCVECDSIILDSFMNCENCGLETTNGLKRQNKIEKAKQLSALAKTKQQEGISGHSGEDCSFLSETSFVEEFSLSMELPSCGGIKEQQDAVDADQKQQPDLVVADLNDNEELNQTHDVVEPTPEQ